MHMHTASCSLAYDYQKRSNVLLVPGTYIAVTLVPSASIKGFPESMWEGSRVCCHTSGSSRHLQRKKRKPRRVRSPLSEKRGPEGKISQEKKQSKRARTVLHMYNVEKGRHGGRNKKHVLACPTSFLHSDRSIPKIDRWAKEKLSIISPTSSSSFHRPVGCRNGKWDLGKSMQAKGKKKKQKKQHHEKVGPFF